MLLKYSNSRFQLHPKALSQYLNIALTAVGTVHIGKNGLRTEIDNIFDECSLLDPG
jgi:hypothetical protein